MKYNLFFLLLMYFFPLYSSDYVYPVATWSDNNGATKVYVMYQHDNHLELLLWDPITKHAHKMLSSLFSPLSVQPLPHTDAFSFIDSGRLRIKKGNKRSPQTIDFNEPIYDINTLHWIDSQKAYLSAKKKDKFALFQLSIDGCIDTLVRSITSDCMYPQKIDSELFYIERSQIDRQYHYEIIQVPYPSMYSNPHATFNDVDTFSERTERFIQSQELYLNNSPLKQPLIATRIADFGTKPIIFLRMITTTQGFVIEHSPSINEDDPVICFSCHYIEKTHNNWSTACLFSFAIPTQLLRGSGQNGLYESLLPLLPRYYDHCFFYVDVSHGFLTVYSYSMESGKKAFCKMSTIGSHFFVPLLVDHFYYCGGSVSCLDDGSNDEVSLYYNKLGQLSLNLPRIGVF